MTAKPKAAAALDQDPAVRQALADAGVNTEPGPFLGFYDPWGNRIEIVGYETIQFTKATHVLCGMGLAHLKKTGAAIAKLAEKAWRNPPTARSIQSCPW